MSKRPHITEATRKNIMDSFWKLYNTKPIECISVKEVTDIAGYNRGTFYLYFKDIYDVLDQIEEDVFKVMEREIARYTEILLSKENGPDFSDVTSATIGIFEACEYKPFVLLGDRGDPRFEKKFKDKIYVQAKSFVDQHFDADDETKEYIIHFFVSGVIGVMKKWYSDGMKISVEEHLVMVCNVLFRPRKIINNSCGLKNIQGKE